jgi:glycosyltransferase involved in cell wall biosynthesis
MRVAFNAWFWHSSSTGSGQYARRLVEALAALDTVGGSGLQIVLVLPADGRTRATLGISELAPSVVVHPVTSARSNLSKVGFEQWAFPRACAEVGADVAHVPYWAPPARSLVPLVVTIHDVIPLVLPPYRGGALQRLYTALVSATARGADLVLTDSDASRRDIVRSLGMPDKKVWAVPLGVDQRYTYEPAPNDHHVRARYNLPPSYVLYLGGFDRRKNLTTVIETYRWAGPAIGEDCPLVVAGQLPEEDTAFTPDPRRLVRDHDVDEDVVSFCGFVDEDHKPALYRGAVAFIFPSRYEGFGLPPLEALACGTPVVGSDVASLPEIVGDAGVLLSPADARGMARALVRLVRDQRFRAELSQRAVAQAARFSWQATAHATLTAYRDAVSRDTAGDDRGRMDRALC